MDITVKQNSIELSPVTEWERQSLKELKNRKIENIRWENSWDGDGDLIIEFKDRNEW